MTIIPLSHDLTQSHDHQVSRRICELYQKSRSGDDDSIRIFLTSHSPRPPPPPPLSSVTPTPQTMCSEEGASHEMEESGETGDVVMEEEEGWEVVRKSHRRSRH